MLTINRAAAIRQVLVVAGVGAERMTTAGYGAEQPVASNETDDGRARNRTEWVVVRR